MHRSLRWTLVILAVAAVAAFWYLSPYLALRGMHAAVLRHDADAFNAYVDYPRLRGSAQQEWTARMSEDLAASVRRGDTRAAGGQALLLAAGARITDALIRPEIVMRMLALGRYLPHDAAPAPGQTTAAAEGPRDVEWHSVRRGANELDIYFGAAATGDANGGIVLRRTGFATWRLAGLRLPRG